MYALKRVFQLHIQYKCFFMKIDNEINDQGGTVNTFADHFLKVCIRSKDDQPHDLFNIFMVPYTDVVFF